MPHHTLPKVAIQFDKERFLCFTNRSLVRLKEQFKIDAVEQFGHGGGEILDVLPKMLWAGMIWADPDLAFDFVNNWFLDNGYPLANKDWALCVFEALTGERPKVDTAGDPPKSDGQES